jgi:hypothetical protein
VCAVDDHMRGAFACPVPARSRAGARVSRGRRAGPPAHIAARGSACGCVSSSHPRARPRAPLPRIPHSPSEPCGSQPASSADSAPPRHCPLQIHRPEAALPRAIPPPARALSVPLLPARSSRPSCPLRAPDRCCDVIGRQTPPSRAARP